MSAADEQMATKVATHVDGTVPAAAAAIAVPPLTTTTTAAAAASVTAATVASGSVPGATGSESTMRVKLTDAPATLTHVIAPMKVAPATTIVSSGTATTPTAKTAPSGISPSPSTTTTADTKLVPKSSLPSATTVAATASSLDMYQLQMHMAAAAFAGQQMQQMMMIQQLMTVPPPPMPPINPTTLPSPFMPQSIADSIKSSASNAAAKAPTKSLQHSPSKSLADKSVITPLVTSKPPGTAKMMTTVNPKPIIGDDSMNSKPVRHFSTASMIAKRPRPDEKDSKSNPSPTKRRAESPIAGMKPQPKLAAIDDDEVQIISSLHTPKPLITKSTPSSSSTSKSISSYKLPSVVSTSTSSKKPATIIPPAAAPSSTSSSNSGSHKKKTHTVTPRAPSPDIPTIGAPANGFTSSTLKYMSGWDYEGYYSRWSEQLGVDILISSLLLAVGSWFHFDTTILGAASGGVAAAIGTLEGGYSRLVEDGLFWKLNKSEGDRMNLGVDDITHRWKEALRRARAKLTSATQKRIHTLAFTHGRGSQGVCMQMHRGLGPDFGAIGKKGGQHSWLRFVPYAGEGKCRCVALQYNAAIDVSPTAVASISLHDEPSVATSLAERMQPIYASVLAALKLHYHSGAFTPLLRLATHVLEDAPAEPMTVVTHREMLLSLQALLPKLVKDFECKPALAPKDVTETILSTPFFQSTARVDDLASSKEVSAVGVALLIEYILHTQRFHSWLATVHDARIEIALGGASSSITVGNAAKVPSTDLHISWLPNSELTRRAKVRHIIVGFAAKDKIIAANNAGFVLPSEVKKDAEKSSAVAKPLISKPSLPPPKPEAEKKRPLITITNSSSVSNKRPSSSSTSHERVKSSNSSTTSSRDRSREREHYRKKQSMIWNPDLISFAPSDPNAPKYTQQAVAAMFVQERHIADLPPGSEEWKLAAKAIPISGALVPPQIRTLMTREDGESGEAYRDRIVYEGFLPYAYDRWITPTQMHRAIGSVFTELKPIWAGMKKSGAKGTEGGFEDWIHASIAQLFAPMTVKMTTSPTNIASGTNSAGFQSMSGGPSTYVRAQMMMQQLRVTRRKPLSVDASPDPAASTVAASAIASPPTTAADAMTDVDELAPPATAPSLHASLLTKEESIQYRFTKDETILPPAMTTKTLIKKDAKDGGSTKRPASEILTDGEADESNTGAPSTKRRRILHGSTSGPNLANWGTSGARSEEHKSAVRQGRSTASSIIDDDDSSDLSTDGETDPTPDSTGALRVHDPSATQKELATLRDTVARLQDQLYERTRCSTCSKRSKGTCVFPCGHSTWCEPCAKRHLGLTVPFEDGVLQELTRQQLSNELKYYCPLQACAARIHAVIRVRPPGQ